MRQTRAADPRTVLDTLRSRRDIAEAVVVRSPGSPDETVVVVVPVEFLTGVEVRWALMEELGAAARDEVIGIASSIPRRADGAVDEPRLMEELTATADIHRFVAPADETERLLAAIWRTTLGCADVGMIDHFIELGGDSVTAVEVIAAIDEATGVDVSLEQLFEAGSVRGLADLVRPRTTGRPGAAASFPLSWNQRFLCLFDSGGDSGPFAPRYHLVFGRRLTGPLDERVLLQALTDVVVRHEALRTVIVRGEQPYQQVLPVSTPTLDIRRCPGVPAADRARWAESFLQEIESGVIDADELPHLRAVLLRFDEQDAILTLMTHHTASDGWSMQVIVRDLAACYAARLDGRAAELPPVRPYRDFVRWENEHAADRSAAEAASFWAETLRGAQLAVLPADHPRSAGLPPITAAYRFRLAPEVAAGIERLVKAERCSPFMVLLAAYYRFLHRITGNTDLVVPTNTAGRAQGRFDDTVGSFFNFVPLRVDIAEHRTAGELIQRTRDTCLSAFDNEIPALQIFAAAPDLMAPVMRDDLAPVTFQALPAGAALDVAGGGNLRWTEIRRPLTSVPVTSGIPDGALWTVNVVSSDDVTGTVMYRVDRFDEATIVRLTDGYQDVLRDLVAEP